MSHLAALDITAGQSKVIPSCFQSWCYAKLFNCHTKWLLSVFSSNVSISINWQISIFLWIKTISLKYIQNVNVVNVQNSSLTSILQASQAYWKGDIGHHFLKLPHYVMYISVFTDRIGDGWLSFRQELPLNAMLGYIQGINNNYWCSSVSSDTLSVAYWLLCWKECCLLIWPMQNLMVSSYCKSGINPHMLPVSE